MITPSELKSYEFKTAGRNAYKADDVDSFFGEVLVSYEKVFRENVELLKRLSLLADKLESYKKDEDNIKQAVLSAQKAADIIVRDAEESVADAKDEAEAILAAARGEADIIKSDAEKQAIADSDLLLSIARDKAEDIINKAKEKAHEILIEANDAASSTVGAATRTITSESIHYDMLKKEVSDFRASILAQYKAHIELISRLPELAVEEAQKIEVPEDESVAAEASDIIKDNVFDDNEVIPESETSVLEFVETFDESVAEFETDSYDIEEDANDEVSDVDAVSESDVATVSIDGLTYDETVSDERTPVETQTEEDVNDAPADIPITKRFSINAENLDFDGFDSDFSDSSDDSTDSQNSADSNDDTINVSENLIEDDVESSSEQNDDDGSLGSFFDSIESIEPDSDKEEKKKQKLGFFRRRK